MYLEWEGAADRLAEAVPELLPAAPQCVYTSSFGNAITAAAGGNGTIALYCAEIWEFAGGGGRAGVPLTGRAVAMVSLAGCTYSGWAMGACCC